MATLYDDAIAYDSSTTPYDLLDIAPGQQARFGPYRLELTSLGTPVAQLSNAVITSVSEGMNDEPGSCSFSLGISDPLLSQVRRLEREIAVYRGPTRIFAGPITDKVTNRSTVDFVAADLSWYLARRNIDRGAGRINKLSNPQFESGLTGWTTVGATSSLDTSVKILGTQSAKLTAATAANDWYLSQTVSITAGSVGEFVTLAAWFYIDAAGWIGGAIDNRGLFLQRTDVAGVVKEFDFAPIDADTTRGTWQRAEVGVHVAPNATETLEIRCYAPGTTGIRWDAASLTLMESLSNYATDAATIAGRIVSFLQSGESGFTDVAKSNLLITSAVTASGTVLDRHYQFVDHTPGDTALGEFSRMGLLDWWVDPARTFRTAAPRRGTDRSATVTLVADRNCILGDGWLTARGADAANQVVMLGDGDGPDREEGAASDSSALGGITYQRIATPKGPAVIDALGAMAAEDLRIAKAPDVVTVEITDRALMEVLGLGDTVAMALRSGSESVTANHRIIRRRWNPTPDTMTCELVPA